MGIVSNHFYNTILPRLLLEEKHPSHIIPRTGEQGKRVNCHSVALFKNGQPRFLLKGFKDGEVTALEWDGSEFTHAKTLTIEEVKSFDIKIRKYRGLNTTIFTDPREYTIKTSLFIDRFESLYERSTSLVSNYFFSRRKAFRIQRMDLLAALVDDRIKGESMSLDLNGVMSLLYTSDWLSHESGVKQVRKVQLYLASLVSSQDLEQKGDNYSVTKKAMVTLDKYAVEESRHKDTLRISRILAFLTLILAIASILQTCVLLSSATQ